MMLHKKRSCPVTKPLADNMTIRNMAQAAIDAYTYQVSGDSPGQARLLDSKWD